MVSLNGTLLTEGVDYNLAYGNNIAPGEATITISPINSAFAEPITVFFYIVKAPFSATIASVPDQLFTGQPVTPTPGVILGDSTLESGHDFIYSYEANTKPGTATVIATAADDSLWTGSVKVESGE